MVGHDCTGRHAQILTRDLFIRQHARSNVGHQTIDDGDDHAGDNDAHGNRPLGVLGNGHHTHGAHGRALAGPAHDGNGAEDACKTIVAEAAVIRSAEEILYIDVSKTNYYKQHQCTHQKDGCNVLEQCDHTVSLDSQQEKERQQNRTAELSVFC